MTLGSSPLGSRPLGSGSDVDRVVEALKLSNDIPTSAREEIKGFVKETYQNLWENLEELINLKPPIELAEYWELFIELVQKLIG